MDIWTLCQAHTKRKKLSVEAWRIIESQSISSTRKIVDNFLEHEILEDEIESRKPKFNAECQGFHYLLATPFRYPPLKYGSRFGKKTEPSLWYGSLKLSTALTESAYYSLALLIGSAMKEFNTPIPKTAFLTKVDTTEGLDLTTKPFVKYKDHISSATDWSRSQLLGSRMREHAIQAFTFFSAREKEADSINLAAFSCKAFSLKKPKSQKHLDQFMSRTFVEFIDKETKDHYVFKIEDFLVNGHFPFPPI